MKRIEVEIKGAGICHPTIGEVKSSSDSVGDIACWFVDDEESSFVWQACF